MMRHASFLLQTLLLAQLLMPGAVRAVEQSCEMPAVPDVPAGARASREQMETAAVAVREFIAQAQAYQLCLQDTEAALGEEITETRRQQLVADFNSAVDAMQVLADEFNVQLGEFNAARTEN